MVDIIIIRSGLHVVAVNVEDLFDDRKVHVAVAFTKEGARRKLLRSLEREER